MLSIVIPTFNEKGNIIKIVQKLKRVLHQIEYEIIFVDDSTDETLKILQLTSLKNPEVKFFHRKQQRGLATAVIMGFQKARGDLICVMDADLQHPPEVLESMLEEIKNGADLVIPSRFLAGGDGGGLKGVRKLASGVARFIAWIFLKQARGTSDPTGGFFMFQKKILQRAHFDPIGWKILLEILVKCDYKRIAEVPYHFKPRQSCESKFSLQEQLNYLKHITRLVKNNPADYWLWRNIFFGASGIALNLVIFDFLIKIFKLNLFIASIIAGGAVIGYSFNYYQWFRFKKSGKCLFLVALLSGISFMLNELIFLSLQSKNSQVAQLLGICSLILVYLFGFKIFKLTGFIKESEKAEPVPQSGESLA